jgi:hypothetical protein
MNDPDRILSPEDEEAYQRYLVFCEVGIDESIIAPINPEWIRNVHSLMPPDSAIPSIAGVFDERMEVMFEEMERNYVSSIKAGIVDYLLKDPETAGRLSLPPVPQAHPFTFGDAISDVPGDKPIDIASGPTVGDPSTCADALAIVKRYGIDMPAAALACLQSGQGESVKPDDPRLQHNQVHIVASPQIALEAAARAPLPPSPTWPAVPGLSELETGPTAQRC